MTRSEHLHVEISSLFLGETVGDCLDALCRTLAACLIVATENSEQGDAAIIEVAGRVYAYVQAYRLTEIQRENVQ